MSLLQCKTICAQQHRFHMCKKHKRKDSLHYQQYEVEMETQRRCWFVCMFINIFKKKSQRHDSA